MRSYRRHEVSSPRLREMRPHQMYVRARARTWACSIREEQTLRRWSTWGGGCCQVQIEQGGFRALKHRGRGVPHRSPRRASKESSTEPEAKGREARQASQTPPGSRHCFKIPGAGPWARGFHVCAGQLGSDRAIAHVLLHPAIFLTSSINHLAWARDASGPWGGGRGGKGWVCCKCRA